MNIMNKSILPQGEGKGAVMLAFLKKKWYNVPDKTKQE